MKNFLFRLWSRRGVRVFCWSAITLLVFVTLLGTLISWSGQRRWLRIKAVLVEEGEKTDFKALIPPPIPQERNFGAIEPLMGINLVEERDEKRGIPGQKRQLLEALKFDLPAGLLAKRGPTLGTKLDLGKVCEALKKSKALALPKDTVNPATAIRDALEKAHPVLKVMAEAARLRPDSEIVPSLRDQKLPPILYSMRVPHYGPMQSAAVALRLHGHACLESGDAAGAVSDALASLRLAEAASKEPWLIGYLVSAQIHQQAVDLVWNLLASRKASEGDLHLLQSALWRIDFEQGLLRAFRGEMIGAADTLDALASNSEQRAAIANVGRGVGSKPSFVADLFADCIPAGFFIHNKAGLVEMQWHHLIKPLKKNGLIALLKEPDAMAKELRGHSTLSRPDLLFARLASPSAGMLVFHAAFTESQRRQAAIACALERHYLRSQTYPQTLDELVPAFLPEVPVDVMDGKPMRYRRTEEGRFHLWSVALDGKDDCGKVNFPQDASLSQISKEGYLGDWT
ncbi:MAG: hypothetical protein U0984_00680, partial [Prosthecobacter sp.]|nr:hypothetical protein [Prosthecobacter sp.]